MLSQAEKRRTNILRLRCLRFFKDGRELQHSDTYLEYADCVSITFEWQKTDKRNDMVMRLALENIILCPLQQWSALVKRIRKYSVPTGDTPVWAVRKNHKIEHVTSAEVVEALRDAVCAIGEDKLGFKEQQVGTNSQRSGATMAMYLGECPVYTIMMIWRWSSDAFLRYIRKQFEKFSQCLSQNDSFPVPPPHPWSGTCSLSLIPQTKESPGNSETRRNIGGNLSRRVRLPVMSLYNWVNR